MSSFPAARFPVLPLSKQKAVTADVGNDNIVLKEISDEILLKQISEGDREALTVLFRRYARLVWSICHRILRDSAEAEDVMQEVFLCIQRKASVFDSSKGPARSLLVHMSYQHALTRRRYLATRHFPALRDRNQPNSINVAAPNVSLYDESIEAHFGKEGLRAALAELSESQRQTLRLYFFEGYTLQEIAEEFGQSLGNVKHHYYRGLNGLRKYMPKRRDRQ